MMTQSKTDAEPCQKVSLRNESGTCDCTHIRYTNEHGWCAECGVSRDRPVFKITDSITPDIFQVGGVDVMELTLCESQKLRLRPGMLYRFTVQEGCRSCERLLAELTD